MNDLLYVLEDKLYWWKWRYGGPRDFWLIHLNRIEDFIKENRLTALDEANYPVPLASAEAGPEVRAKIRPRPFPGGIRVAHLHSKGEVYLMSQEHWKKFSSQMLNMYREKLAKVNTVPFDSLIDMSEAGERMS